MSFDAHLPARHTPLAATAQESMVTTTKKFIGAVKDEWQLYSDCAADYTIGAPIGFGASSIVYAATYRPSDPSSSNAPPKGIPCALKVLDLDSLPPRSLQLLQRETTLMSLSKHPNVLRVRGSWMDGHKLYIALRLMNKGSAADVMHYGWPGGMEEDVVRCILRQALKGLNYLHINGFIHRDIKAANLLIDDDGTVLLGDLGVAADLAEDTSQVNSSSHSNKFSITATTALPSSRSSASTISASSGGKRAVAFDDTVPVISRPKIGKRKSFVGTPCWMAPELIQGKQYDSSADIWSFGITALELTQGRPPRSRESPQRVLLKTIQEDPPTLDREGGTYKYSRAFKEVVDSCLVKDPTKRPTAEELLQTPFFKAAKNKSYLINIILKDLPPLVQRQERRSIQHITSANSIDSWDFATTINSPTTSVYRRRVLEDFVAAEDEELKALGGFMADEQNAAVASLHSRNISWSAGPGVSIHEEAETEPEVIVPSSPTTTESSVLSSGVDGSPSSGPSTSAPSSYMDASELACTPQAAKPSPESKRAEPPLAPIAEHNGHPTLIVQKSALPQSVSVPLTIGSSRPSNSPGPASQHGLWNKIKANVKRPSSRGGLSDSDTFEGSPRTDKEKGKMGSIFSTANRCLLSRNSSRSLLHASKEGK